MTRSMIAVLLTAGLVFAGCGGSDNDKAVSEGGSQQDQTMSQVCAARADIKKQLDTLTSMTASTFTADGVKTSLQSIRDDLKTLASAQRGLTGDRKQAIQQANSQFKTTVESVGSTLLKSLSASDAAAQLKSAAGELKTSYEKALAPIDC
jgi:hypothetical protein